VTYSLPDEVEVFKRDVALFFKVSTGRILRCSGSSRNTAKYRRLR
jgi:hypothetical protein